MDYGVEKCLKRNHCKFVKMWAFFELYKICLGSTRKNQREIICNNEKFFFNSSKSFAEKAQKKRTI